MDAERGAPPAGGADVFAAHARPPVPEDDPDTGERAPDRDGTAEPQARHAVVHRLSPAHRAVPAIRGALPGAALVIAAGLGLVALVIAFGGHAPSAPVAPPSAAPPSAPAVPTATASASATPEPGALRATEVYLPTVDVRSALVELDVGPDGTLQTPPDPAVAGWFVGASAPGEPGPTVIAGHVDSRSGPGVFLRLDELAVGDRVEVTRSDGRVVAHRVVTVERHPKSAFPTARVYGPTPGPELRLITCGGDFDRRSRHYRDNVVVTAVATT